MAPILFAAAIAGGEPIKVFNHGEMWRDFTYIDDIVDGVLRALDRPPSAQPPHAIYNLGNHKSEKLTDFIAEIEKAMGKKAEKIMEPMQPGDVPATYADIEASTPRSRLHAHNADQRGHPEIRGLVQELLRRPSAPDKRRRHGIYPFAACAEWMAKRPVPPRQRACPWSHRSRRPAAFRPPARPRYRFCAKSPYAQRHPSCRHPRIQSHNLWRDQTI